jgi:hypothetical protein
MEARYVLMHLRRCGVVVHHAAPMPPDADGHRSVVVFLEGALQQCDLARRCALRLPGVLDVWFSGHTRTIMYVSGSAVTAKRSPGPVQLRESARRRTSRRSRS